MVSLSNCSPRHTRSSAGGKPERLPVARLRLSIMHITRITTLQAFDAARSALDRAYDADPHATVFLSPPWLRGWLSTSPHEWMILAAAPRAGADPVAFWPLSRLPSPSALRADRVVTLRMSGWPAADYTGFISDPACDREAARALLSHVQSGLTWDTLELHDLADVRLIDAAESFGGNPGLRRSAHRRTPCPCVDLPGTWDDFLADTLGYSSRGTLRRRIKRLEKRDDYRVQDVTDGNLARITGDAFRLWQQRFPNDVNIADQPRYEALFQAMFEVGDLWARGLYVNDEAIAAAVGFFDRPQRAFRYYITGYADGWHRNAPGRVVLAYAIQAAIDQKMTCFDFLRGAEAYKRDFGADDRFTQSFVFQRTRPLTTLRLGVDALKRRIKG